LRDVTTEKTISDNELTAIAQDDRTAKLIEKHFDIARPSEFLWQVGDAFELARLTIPYGQLGIVRQCEVDWYNPMTDASNLQPYTSDALIDNAVARFHVRIEPISVRLGGRAFFNVGVKGPAGLPGQPYYYAEPWQGGFYSFGNSNNALFWPVPHGYHIRLFVLIVAAMNPARQHWFGGRMKASIQSESHISSAWMARRNFNRG
jgi:hypothetical protein